MKRILIQLDTDALPSSFDRVVAVDAGAEQIFSYGGVTTDNVETLVHGAIFTRKPSDLKSTAIFVGGSDVAAGDALFRRVLKSFYGPMRVSVMMDSNGSNTTAAATVLAINRHLPCETVKALILAGTGPVGLRAAQILASQGATVKLGSRTREKAQAACTQLGDRVDARRLIACETQSPQGLADALDGVNVLIAAGAAGIRLLTLPQWRSLSDLRVAIDINAVPPSGIEGIEVMDKAVEKHGIICYGAIGVGGLKMKIHTAALQRLFENNSYDLDTAAIFDIGRQFA